MPKISLFFSSFECHILLRSNASNAAGADAIMQLHWARPYCTCSRPCHACSSKPKCLGRRTLELARRQTPAGTLVQSRAVAAFAVVCVQAGDIGGGMFALCAHHVAGLRGHGWGSGVFWSSLVQICQQAQQPQFCVGVCTDHPVSTHPLPAPCVCPALLCGSPACSSAQGYYSSGLAALPIGKHQGCLVQPVRAPGCM